MHTAADAANGIRWEVVRLFHAASAAQPWTAAGSASATPPSDARQGRWLCFECERRCPPEIPSKGGVALALATAVQGAREIASHSGARPDMIFHNAPRDEER